MCSSRLSLLILPSVVWSALLSACDSQDGAQATDRIDGGGQAVPRDAGQSEAGPTLTADGGQDASNVSPALSNVPAERLYQAVDLSDKQCVADTDCVVFFASASCIDDCTVSALSRDAGVSRAYTVLASVETELCKHPEAVATLDPVHGRAGSAAACPQGPNWFAHCGLDQRCLAVSPICPQGCEPSGDSCTGAAGAPCDGCPAYPSESDRQPCSEPGKVCDYAVSCGIDSATCEDVGNGPRWSVTVLAC